MYTVFAAVIQLEPHFHKQAVFEADVRPPQLPVNRLKVCTCFLCALRIAAGWLQDCPNSVIEFCFTNLHHTKPVNALICLCFLLTIAAFRLRCVTLLPTVSASSRGTLMLCCCAPSLNSRPRYFLSNITHILVDKAKNLKKVRICAVNLTAQRSRLLFPLQDDELRAYAAYQRAVDFLDFGVGTSALATARAPINLADLLVALRSQRSNTT